MRNRRHRRLIILGLAVSLLAVIFIGNELDLGAVNEALSTGRFEYIVPCIILLLSGLVFRALRWQLLLGNALPLSRSFHVMNVSYLVNAVLPLRVGEVVRAYLVWRGKPSVPVMTTFGSVVVERILDLLAVVLMVGYALAVGPVPDELRSAGILFGAAGFVGFLTLIFLARWRALTHHLLGLITKRIRFLGRWELSSLLDHFLDGLMPLASLRTLLFALLFTTVGWAMSIAAGYVLMYAFYDTPSLAATMLYIAAAALAIAVPATVGNIGIYEASIMLALGAFAYGDSSEMAFAFAVTVHAVNVMIHCATGMVGIFVEGISWDQLSAGVREISDEVNTDFNQLVIHEAAD